MYLNQQETELKEPSDNPANPVEGGDDPECLKSLLII